jgi:2-dehydropantoate 2-reductase
MIGPGALAHAIDADLMLYRSHIDTHMVGRSVSHKAPDTSADLILVTVKAYDLAECLSRIDTHAVVMVACNGIVDDIVRSFSDRLDLRLAQTSFAAFKRNGYFCITSQNPFFRFGSLGGRSLSPMERKFLSIVDSQVYQWTDNPLAGMWHKWAMNVAINLSSVALGLNKNGDLLDHQSTVKQFLDVLYPYYLAAGNRLTQEQLWLDIKTIILATKDNVNSTLDDVQHHRRSEIDFLLKDFDELKKLMGGIAKK